MCGAWNRITNAVSNQPQAFAPPAVSTPVTQSGMIYAQLLATFQPVTPADIPPSIPAAAPSAQPPVLSSEAPVWTSDSSLDVRQAARNRLGSTETLKRHIH